MKKRPPKRSFFIGAAHEVVDKIFSLSVNLNIFIF